MSLETKYGGLQRLRQRLSDKLKIEKYKEAFDANSDFFSGSVVLDVGCGEGLLSMMAVKVRLEARQSRATSINSSIQAGAALVIGVDSLSDLHVTERIVEANQMTDKIRLMRGRIEELTLPEGLHQVDVIISDCLESGQIQTDSLQPVILARDGFMIPQLFLRKSLSFFLIF